MNLDDRVREDGLVFWMSCVGWPRETSTQMFLGRVLGVMGETMFPDDWVNQPMADSFVPTFFRGVDYQIDPESFAGEYLKNISKIHNDEFEPLEAYFRFAMDDHNKNLDMVFRVIDQLLAALANGELKAFRQKIGGGTPFEEIPAIEWTTEGAENWFLFCHQGPYAHSPSMLKQICSAYDIPSFIFVERASLDTYIYNWTPFTPYGNGTPIPAYIVNELRHSRQVGSHDDVGGNEGISVEFFEQKVPSEQTRRSKRLVVKKFIHRLFPDGVPDVSAMSDTHFVNLVAKAMEQARKEDPLLEKAPSRETILRAAGRK